MNVWPHFDLGVRPPLSARRGNVPLAFMHIPKCGGTSLMHALSIISPKGPHIRGFDQVTFGTFRDFDTIPPVMRRQIHLAPEDFAPYAATIFGHFALSTLEQHYPDADIITILREPTSRLLSHWLYWRGLTWRQLRFWGPAWSARLKLAVRPLAEFLNAPDIACQTDNIVTRMLLWPHRLIPENDFINPADDAAILTIARARLQRFNLIGIAEDRAQMASDFDSWFGAPLPRLSLNSTTKIPRWRHTRLYWELCPDTVQTLHQRSRLDAMLWREVAHRRVTTMDPTLLQDAARLRAVANCSFLLG